MVAVFEVTREFIGGNLKGLTYTGTQRHQVGLEPKVGQKVEKPCGGSSPYVIVKVTRQ